MAATYKATGINLKGMPLGEQDRLLTVLTREYGLIRVIAPGARKHQSKLAGRSGLFVVNELLISQGRSLDRIQQAETLESFPKLSQDLRKLTAGQYLAEVALCQAMTEQPQEELFELLTEHLHRLESFVGELAIACLVHAVFQLMGLAGLAPRVDACCATQEPIQPNFTNPNWYIGFSAIAGGIVTLPEFVRLQRQTHQGRLAKPITPKSMPQISPSHRLIKVGEATANWGSSGGAIARSPVIAAPHLFAQVNALQLQILQQLDQTDLLEPNGKLLMVPSHFNAIAPPLTAEAMGLLKQPIPTPTWLSLEQLLRDYVQYQFDRLIRSASLIETCFPPNVSMS
jgi:DNA repair protein RecO (recombination protein O)